MRVRLWSDASYLLAAEAQRKDYGVELVSEDVFTYNDQVVKQLAMISEKQPSKKQGKASIVHEMMIAEVETYSANIQVGDWAMGGTLAAHEIGC